MNAWRQPLRRLAIIAGIVGSVAILLCAIAPRPWPLCLLTPFVPQWTFLAFLLLFFGPRPTSFRTRVGRIGWACWLLAGVAISLCLLPTGLPGPIARAVLSTESSAPVIRFLAANVHSGNNNYDALRRLIVAEKPDIILLTEISGNWLREMEPLTAEYPYRRVVPDDLGNFGMGLWSKYRLVDAEFKLFKPADDVGLTDTPQLDATFELPDRRRVRVLGLHPLPPIRPSYAAARDAVLRDVARSVADVGEVPTVVLGDLNATRYCAITNELAGIAGMKDALASIKTTWPNRWSWPVMGIRIDHILVSHHWLVADARVGADIGSDHWPVLATLLLKAPATMTASASRFRGDFTSP